ncbi:glutamine amidotransferase-related protein [Marinomonas posidonica]|uniref:Glutamine amidotransferase class-I n=1 Tax=Marinomonas posidonica (strain CECT 7376 / NCIMB 14433 / IVIA-Po-181) TaxID=491952 RepID=F6CSX8_MARPP|nr:glutamine amidotransferase [Marinomonas posidonica]AEF53968.1 glutamine amidotransferase class-I [Marinomonas posidonica IVIA-Po-181]
MKIGILAAGITPEPLREHYPTYAQMFTDQIGHIDPQLEFKIFDVRLNEFPADCQVCDAWLVTGSKADAYADEKWILNLCDFIRNIDQQGQVLVGICFGHQIIARALGGKVEKYSGGWGVGVHHYQLAEQVTIPQLSDTKDIAICAFHQDQVIEKPSKMQTFLSSEFCPYAGLIYQDRILTFQGHPEFSKTYESDLIKLYEKTTLPPEVVTKAHQSLAKDDIQNQALMTWITQFLTA